MDRDEMHGGGSFRPACTDVVVMKVGRHNHAGRRLARALEAPSLRARLPVGAHLQRKIGCLGFATLDHIHRWRGAHGGAEEGQPVTDLTRRESVAARSFPQHVEKEAVGLPGFLRP
jgi:hypothetical protein